MLQFQSLGTLAAAPGLLDSVGWNMTPAPGPKPTGMGLGLCGAASADDAELEVLLPTRTAFHVWKTSLQWLHAREGVPRGLYSAFSSSGTRAAEWISQKMLPQHRQWWRRVK